MYPEELHVDNLVFGRPSTISNISKNLLLNHLDPMTNLHLFRAGENPALTMIEYKIQQVNENHCILYQIGLGLGLG